MKPSPSTRRVVVGFSLAVVVAAAPLHLAVSRLLHRSASPDGNEASEEERLLARSVSLLRRLHPQEEVVCLGRPGDASGSAGQSSGFFQVGCTAEDGAPRATLNWERPREELAFLSWEGPSESASMRPLSAPEAKACALQWVRVLGLASAGETPFSLALRARTERLWSFGIRSGPQEMLLAVDAGKGDLMWLVAHRLKERRSP